MVINKRWKIGESEYLLTQNLNQNRIIVHINAHNLSEEKVDTLFSAYKCIFENLGTFRISTVDGIINIIADSKWECEIDFLGYDMTIIDRNNGELIKYLKGHNLYECFDMFLCMLEDNQ